MLHFITNCWLPRSQQKDICCDNSSINFRHECLRERIPNRKIAQECSVCTFVLVAITWVPVHTTQTNINTMIELHFDSLTNFRHSCLRERIPSQRITLSNVLLQLKLPGHPVHPSRADIQLKKLRDQIRFIFHAYRLNLLSDIIRYYTPYFTVCPTFRIHTFNSDSDSITLSLVLIHTK